METLTLKEIQTLSLEILKDVHSFCISHEIKYSLAYGTLIGAVRHHGFIPWDDDIDIIMPRPDYEFFLKTYKSTRFKLCSQYCTDSYLTFSRVYDDSDTYSVSCVPHCSYESGVWIDIFPVDGVSDEHLNFIKQVDCLTSLWHRQIANRTAKASVKSYSNAHEIIKFLIKKTIRLGGFNIKRINARMTDIAKTYQYGTTSHWSQLACMDDGTKNYQLLEDFNSTILLPFEDAYFLVMNGYDRVLTNIYGNYMVMPPEGQRCPKQSHVLFYWKNK